MATADESTSHSSLNTRIFVSHCVHDAMLCTHVSKVLNLL